VGWAEPTELLRSADIAMYAAKRDGKGRVRHFREHMHDAARNELLLRMDLAVALTAGQLSLAYQPILNARQRTISGFEALLRWHHPERGPVPPNEFIPLAEQSGLIVQIGEWVLREACHRASCWHQSGGNAPYVSVNVSAMQLADSNFVRTVMDALASSRLEPSRLVLEITESMLVEDGALARRTLSQLRSMGVRVAIDDFGTGYSSLAFLRELQVDIVKIDQAFVRDLAVDDDRKALTRTMLSLADGLSMTAIAEGVEAETELAELLRMGCGFAQGYLFSKPVAAVDLDGFLASVGLSVETS
jgi:EAL domain-containing protein (putative c-di-GMP-specific phosphodiesterase class I)